jgi:hypothetical protein
MMPPALPGEQSPSGCRGILDGRRLRAGLEGVAAHRSRSGTSHPSDRTRRGRRNRQLLLLTARVPSHNLRILPVGFGLPGVSLKENDVSWELDTSSEGLRFAL